MRIYAVSDIHAKPHRLEIVRAQAASLHPDVVVVAGDIINYFHSEPVLESLNNLPAPVLAVRGNSDPAFTAKHFIPYPRISLLHLNDITIDGISFVGISGTIPMPFRTRIRFREKHLMEKIGPMVNKEAVCIVHPPPFGTLDRVGRRFHAGSTLVRDLVVQKQPQLLICGHIHEDAGMAKLGATVVVNCSVTGTGKGALIELSRGATPIVKLL